ncbi:MAG TPA: DUF4344 domain-containing metallopeptidase [Pyrinomonadaceae bacterium]|jgi:hypothetical protein|nr:DUF4344 domain-containing metallopeptidase [Pyrinomonadaceae bacterium]
MLLSKNVQNALIAAMVFFFVAACVCPTDRSQRREQDQDYPSRNPQTDQPERTQKTPKTPDPSKKPDNGDFVVEHLPVTNPRYIELDKQIRQEKLLERAADELNQALILPEDITLRTKDCREINAFYNPNDSSVTMCYELMEHFYQVFRAAGRSEEEAYNQMFDAVRFVFLHEIAHALIDKYKLPVVSNEEDAADRCSAYINLEELGDEGVKAVLAAADAFLIESKLSKKTTNDLSDEHLLSEQRFYTALCMTYGSNETKYARLVTDGYLPRERAARCPADYQKTVESWKELLKDWRKN